MIINFSDQEAMVNNGIEGIFLAGPTMRNSSFKKSWRKDACDFLEKVGYNGIVYVPEHEDDEQSVDFMDQVDWERACLMNAKVIVFYVPRKFPDMPGLTTNVEYGTYIVKRPEAVLLCCPEGSEKNRYLEWLYEKEKGVNNIYRTLEDILTAAKELAES